MFCYGVVSYLIFLGVFTYAVGWLGNFGVPNSIDAPPRKGFWSALGINVGLLIVFAIQHSVMARSSFKSWMTQVVAKEAERSTYVLASNLAMILMFRYWEPMGMYIWRVEDEYISAALYGMFFVGWLVVLVSSFLINHFDLLGVRQVWLYLVGKPYTYLQFNTPGLYKYVRHPLYVGWFIAFWVTPTMTLGHLVFALGTSAYMLFAIPLEERDLERALGASYTNYKKRVPMLIPRVKF